MEKIYKHSNSIYMNALHTCVDLVVHIQNSYSNPNALNYRDEQGWHADSTAVFVEKVKYLVLGLQQLGLKKGDRVGILAQPSPHWTIADLAIIIAGGISVPLFANISDDNFLYEVTDSGMRMIFVDGGEQWDSCLRHQELFDIAIALGKVPQHGKSVAFEKVLEKGRLLEEKQPHLYDQINTSNKSDDLAAIIYTSGSTGVPKGVELTQENLMGVVHFDKFDLDPKKDVYLSVLPLAHVFGHCINFWALAWGISVYYFNDYKSLGVACQEIKPTTMVAVPRLLEKVYNKMVEKVHDSRWIKRTIGEWAFALARMEDHSWYKRLFGRLADLIVYSKLRKGLGGRLRVVLSGGAALNPHLHIFFQEIGIPIYEGWGLTEACPVCVNIPDKNKIGTVGPPMVGQQLAVTPEGEVLVKGQLVMRGYHHDPAATAQTIDNEGWLHTGDRGFLDSDGYLTILGRMKELYKTSTGEYVAPVPIEQALTRHPLIDMAMVVADGRKFSSCLLFPNFDVLSRLKARQGSEKMGDKEFLSTPYICKEMVRLIENINRHLNHWEQIHEYRFILDPLTIEGGELTPSMKIRREVVAKKYKLLIDQIYHEEFV